MIEPTFRRGDLLQIEGHTSVVSAVRATRDGVVVDVLDRTPASMGTSRPASMNLELLELMLCCGLLRLVRRPVVPVQRRRAGSRPGRSAATPPAQSTCRRTPGANCPAGAA